MATQQLTFSVAGGPVAPAIARAGVCRFVRPLDQAALSVLGELVTAVLGDAVRASRPFSTEAFVVSVDASPSTVRVQIAGPRVGVSARAAAMAARCGSDDSEAPRVWFEVDA